MPTIDEINTSLAEMTDVHTSLDTLFTNLKVLGVNPAETTTVWCVYVTEAGWRVTDVPISYMQTVIGALCHSPYHESGISLRLFPTSSRINTFTTPRQAYPLLTGIDKEANDMAEVNDKKEVNITTNRDSILIGYELETDSWDADKELDEEAYNDAISEWVDNNMPNTRYLSDSVVESIREELIEEASNHVYASDYETELDYNSIARDLKGFRAHRDGTVDGPEIVLDTPQNIDTAKEMCDNLFDYVDNHSATINRGCSFHIHLSVQGRTHTYGLAIQSLMIDYVMQQALAGRLPASLLDRWCNGSLADYFHLDLDNDRYNFVAHRGATWEFRCFGNIDNARDAKECIDVAVEAYSWAYAMVKLHGPNEAVTRVLGDSKHSHLVSYFKALLENDIEEKLTELRNVASRRRA